MSLVLPHSCQCCFYQSLDREIACNVPGMKCHLTGLVDKIALKEARTSAEGEEIRDEMLPEPIHTDEEMRQAEYVSIEE